MEKGLLNKGISVMFQNRYCDQEDFDIIISGRQYDSEREKFEPNIYNVMYPGFTAVTTLVANSNNEDKVLTSGSSIWITRTPKTEEVDSSGMSPVSYGVKNNIIELPDIRKYYCASSFINTLYVFGGVSFRRLRVFRL